MILREVKTCPLCGGENHILYIISPGDPIPGSEFRLCQDCGHVFMAPLPEEQWIDKFYEVVYKSSQVDMDASEISQDQYYRGVRQCHMLARTVPAPKHVLEIGSAIGIMASALCDIFSPDRVIGVEPSDHFRSMARETCGRWFEEDACKIEFVKSLKDVNPKPKFDLIVISHVLEHIVNPLKYLKTLKRKYLTNDGSIFIEVPNFFGKAQPVFDFPHIHYFHDATLRLMIKKAGLHVWYSETQGSWPPFWIIPKFLLAVARPMKPTYNKDTMGSRYTLHQDYVRDIEKVRIKNE